MAWSDHLDDPIVLATGITLRTLNEAARYIQQLPATTQKPVMVKGSRPTIAKVSAVASNADFGPVSRPRVPDRSPVSAVAEQLARRFGVSGRDVLHRPHDRFLDLRLGEREFAAVAHPGDEIVKLQTLILDGLHVGLLGIGQDAIGMAHGVVDRAVVGS
jgi:hypothetical protein